MIGFLQGKVININLKSCLILTSGGVGYSVFPAGNLSSQLKKGAEISCFIFTVVREQEISLYGFGSEDEQKMFEKLLGVSGVGPKMALNIVSSSLSNFVDAIDQDNLEVLCKIPGVGKKLSQKLILELKGKLVLGDAQEIPTEKIELVEAVSALENLGYTKKDILEILKKADKKQDTAEKLIKFFLANN
jgi:Holliday junction DNA helicase RuvA